WATRADGLEFKVEIVLPVGHSEGERPAALFWHYPREYEDEDAYREGIRDFSPNAFPEQRPRSMDTLVRLGYAVVDPDVPIVGPRERWNDRYVVDLRNSLAAAIDALDERGWIDRSRLAIGGHSYGGFGTINALVRTPFFKAGIAGSANSNRSLTPAGFQREDRILWEARETYVRMSPLFWINEMSGALLLYHGMDDQNVGTFPDHSVRSFHAMNTLGKTGALYMYPFEDHGPDAEETLLDLWARWTAWLDAYVMRAGEAGEAVTEGTEEGRR
nr:prolyl oligopeptidase family serine peptidase [Gemmatimonadota bacterium]NIR79341.1 prolyl oligopeptidase family serine peptidase [Gemmatimonadota bacterium]NIT88008.1 prolyl oligopeptidase family serine peptidase [Gemmatimonadota bacterium]NIU31854.1 prolyl oligopeptidase family serine peptidase [Gemmatimonadota bacterium]NIU36460.1 prolyl oligopeptidase family serine peptidase [Gemmatimonadota bacterium]